VQVHYGEGVAIRIGRDPCVDTREGAGEASVGERLVQTVRYARGSKCGRHYGVHPAALRFYTVAYCTPSYPPVPISAPQAVGGECPTGGPDTKVRFTHARPERHKNFYL
jgi:hypothetical protein